MGDVQKMRFDKIRFLCMEMVSILPVIFCESVFAMLLLSDCVNSLLILRKRISVLLAEITST